MVDNKEQAIYNMALSIADFTVSDKSISSRKLSANLYELGYRLKPSREAVAKNLFDREMKKTFPVYADNPNNWAELPDDSKKWWYITADEILALTPELSEEGIDNIIRNGQQYTMIQFPSEGVVIIKENRIEISKEIIVDDEPAITSIWHGTLNELILALTPEVLSEDEIRQDTWRKYSEYLINRGEAGLNALPENEQGFWKGYWQSMVDTGNNLKG